MEIHPNDNLTFEQWQTHWYNLHRDLFGERVAKEWLKENLNHDTIMKMLWTEKGFKTYGDYRKWEENHIEERNEYFRQRGDSYDDLHTGGHGGRVSADGFNQGGMGDV